MVMLLVPRILYLRFHILRIAINVVFPQVKEPSPLPHHLHREYPHTGLKRHLDIDRLSNSYWISHVTVS